MMLDGMLRLKASYMMNEDGIIRKVWDFKEIYSIKNLKGLYKHNKFLFLVLIIETFLFCSLLYIPFYLNQVSEQQNQIIMDYFSSQSPP